MGWLLRKQQRKVKTLMVLAWVGGTRRLVALRCDHDVSYASARLGV